ncbi:alpha/beta hydrolase [Arsenicicoccus dermatophilus]|uniref:alpha/beta hydrolase n=1 Tax=Arsenicicoccus dermatophilus TaxID=1076331 RepID=UPI001F4C5546|nr:alpha/beta hydrolase [Arsenicicoccus dermatophilus]MCH8611565.1 alpha/beta hydrolase [Arsenicicoccus dermatophilus]
MTTVDHQEFTADDEAQLAALLRRLAPQDWPEGLEEGRRYYDGWGSPVADDITQRCVSLGAVPAVELTPPDGDTGRIGLWLHGGAYVQGSHASHGSMVAEIARACGHPFVHPLYRLAPENPFPMAVEDALAAYRSLLVRGWSGREIVVGGDSAGGGLAVAMMLTARDRGLPLPACATLVSPWVDLAGTGRTLVSNAGADPLVDAAGCASFAQTYLAGAHPRHPLASPLYADLTGLPPTLIQVGTREVLLSDSRRLHSALTTAGVDVTLETWRGQIHVWHLHHAHLRQAREAIADLGRFTRGQ